MLVLSRKVGERILIGDKVVVTVVRLAQGGVRLGIEAPNDMLVVREELQREELPTGQSLPVSNNSPEQANTSKP